MSRKISYAVIALTKKDAEKLIYNLKNEYEVQRYLKNNYLSIYGESPDEWKPFKSVNKNISEIINQNLVENCISHTAFINQNLHLNLSQLLSGVEVLFIDIFALYMEKYSLFSMKADYACDRGIRHKCCFLIDMFSILGVYNKLLNKKNEVWSSVSHCYIKGCQSNKIIFSIDELDNFKNYLINLPEYRGEPSSKNDAQAYRMFEPFVENHDVPRFEEYK